MKRDEFLKGLAEALPDDLFCNSLEIKFQVSAEQLGEATKQATEQAKRLMKEWNCGASVSVTPEFCAITIGFEV